MSKEKKSQDLLSRTYWNGTIKMSLSKFFILRVLHNRPMHGYDIAKEVEQTTDGCCSPTEGAIYPILKEFENGGYATCAREIVSGRERKVYTITEKGREAFKIGLESWMDITKCLLECQPIVEDCCETGACCDADEACC